MTTVSIQEASIQAPWAGWLNPAAGPISSQFVNVFGSRIFSIARHILQTDEDAGNVLIETFLEACLECDSYRNQNEFRLRLMTIAVQKAFSTLYKRGVGSRPGPADDSSEGLVIRELSFWGDDYQERYSREQTNHILENALRSLDPMARAIFVLRDMEEIPIERIAGIVNRSLAAVEVCLLRARLHLREVLDGPMRQRP